MVETITEVQEQRLRVSQPRTLFIKCSLEACAIVLSMHTVSLLEPLNKPTNRIQAMFATTYVAKRSHECDAFSLKNLHALSAQSLHIMRVIPSVFEIREP